MGERNDQLMTVFTELPSLPGLYLRALWLNKPKLVPPGQTVPRIEARWTAPRVNEQNLAAYRAICGFNDDDTLPLTYPHVMVSAMHLAMLLEPAFPVRLLGLVHLENRIEALRELPPTLTGEFVAWLEGHEDTERTQRFDLHTEWRDGEELLWRERTSFVAQKPAPRRERPAATAARRPDDATRTPLLAPAGHGRRYSRIGGDINPIHLFDVTARLFGFKRAIMHGMWSLARCVVEMKAIAPCVVDVRFQRPVFLPATLVIERLRQDDGEDFAVLDANSEKSHLTGTLRRL